MALDLNSILLGLAVAGVPLLAFIWQLQRRASAHHAELALLEERLNMAQLAQEGLNAQLDASRDEISDLGQANAAKQAELAALSSNARRDFPSKYDALIGLFHSGGLHRGKSRIANHPGQFVAAVADILDRRNLSPAEAFTVLHRHFGAITGAGINLLTEILHALDNKRFAVMNQNEVSGLALAGIRDYPLHPTKQNVSAESYARYCGHADTVRRSLGLDDFTELDALFNYAYWRETEEDEAAT